MQEGLSRRGGAKPTPKNIATPSGDDGRPKDIFEVKGAAEGYGKDAQLTLMEQMILLAINDREGTLSYFNSDELSEGIRGCIIIELALRNRIKLENTGMRKKSIFARRIEIKDDTPCGDVLLDEAMGHIKAMEEKDNVESWIAYLNGQSWNPFKAFMWLKNVRERIMKGLVEKSVLSVGSQTFIVIEQPAYPLSNPQLKQDLIKKVQDILLKQCPTDITKMDPRKLALLLMAHSCGVLETAYAKLRDQEYDLAMKRLNDILSMDFESVAVGHGTGWELIWACIGVFESQ